MRNSTPALRGLHSCRDHRQINRWGAGSSGITHGRGGESGKASHQWPSQKRPAEWIGQARWTGSEHFKQRQVWKPGYRTGDGHREEAGGLIRGQVTQGLGSSVKEFRHCLEASFKQRVTWLDLHERLKCSSLNLCRSEGQPNCPGSD